MIVLIGGEKGGSSKSTTAINLAVYLSVKKQDVIILDADPQGTAAKWVERRNKYNPDLPKIHCVQKTGDVFETINDLSKRYQQIIIDAGGRDSEELRSAMVASQVLYTPIRASQADLETTVHMNKLVKLAKGMNRNLKAYLLISMAPTHHKVTEVSDAKEILSELDEFVLSGVQVKDRKVYRDAILEGKGVIELNNIQAKEEIELLGQEIYGD